MLWCLCWFVNLLVACSLLVVIRWFKFVGVICSGCFADFACCLIGVRGVLLLFVLYLRLTMLLMCEFCGWIVALVDVFGFFCLWLFYLLFGVVFYHFVFYFHCGLRVTFAD